MRHAHAGRKLGVTPHHRKALLRNLTLALIEKETIRTTPARAKELRWFAERVVTLGKRGDLHSRRTMVSILGSTQTQHAGENRVRNALEKVYSTLVPRFKDRPGGYTQIFRLATRRAGDNAQICIMRYIPAPEEKKGGSKKAAPKGKASSEAAGESKKAVATKPKAEKAAPEDKASDKPAKPTKGKKKEE